MQAQAGSRPVARFYFHLRNDLDVPDDEGAELADLGAARDHARKAILDVMAGTLLETARITLSHRIDIEDVHGRVLDTVIFQDVVEVEG